MVYSGEVFQPEKRVVVALFWQFSGVISNLVLFLMTLFSFHACALPCSASLALYRVLCVAV